jgi:hypothetical protein
MRNASEEEKDLAWKRIADILGIPNGKIIRILLQGLYGELAKAVRTGLRSRLFEGILSPVYCILPSVCFTNFS